MRHDHSDRTILIDSGAKQVILCRSRENPRRDHQRRQHIRKCGTLGASPFNPKTNSRVDESVKNSPSDSGGFGS